MSLISPRNFIAPFTNTVNLAAIIAVALVFGIYRLSGGGVGITTRKSVAPVVKQAPQVKSSYEEEELPASRPVEKETVKSLRPPDDDTSFDDLLDKGRDRVAPKPAGPSRSNSNNSLDEIAKQLGVE